MNKTKFSAFLFFFLVSLPIFSSWTDNHEVNAQFIFNNGDPATIRLETTLGLNLSQQVAYNLLCFTLGATGIGIACSGIMEFLYCCEEEPRKRTSENLPGWWKTSIGLLVTTSSLLLLFQYKRLTTLFDRAMPTTG